MTVSIEDQIKCVTREIGMRRSVFGRRVADNKMTQAKADHEIAAMEAVLVTLQRVQEATPGTQGSML